MKIININNENITFDNGMLLSYFHEQDCCESVYADFMYIKTYNAIGGNKTVFDLDFDEDFYNKIDLVKEEGFKFFDKEGNSIFVPCYNEQNGYYSGNLELQVYKDDKMIKSIDIEECAKCEFD